MNPWYLLPSLFSALFLLSIALYLLIIKPRTDYVPPLMLICLAIFLWNIATVFLNVSGGSVFWAELGSIGLIFIPPLILHFAVKYTGFATGFHYLIAYIPAFLLLPVLVAGDYVVGVAYRQIGYEPLFNQLPFSVSSFLGLLFTVFSTFLLFKHYRDSVGIKKRQTLYILFAIPANFFFSFISYVIFFETLELAQFPVGATFDFITVALIIYAVVRFKLPVERPAEIDFRNLAEMATEGICIIDKEGYIDYSNAYFMEMTKRTEREILGTFFPDFMTPKSKGLREKRVHELKNGGIIERLEVTLQHGDGEIIAEINTSPIVWNDEVVGSFITIRDVTDRKKIEQELRKQKIYFEALFEGSPEAVVSLDSNHRVVDLNSAFVKLFCYTIDELRGKELDDFLLPPEEQTAGRRLSYKVTHGEVIHAEGQRLRKDRRPVTVSILGAPVFIEGKQVGIFAIYRDIGARKEAEQEREFYNSLLRHDIANKNTVILGNLELLDVQHIPEDQQMLVTDARRAAQSSNELIEKIRELNRIGEERELSLVNLHAVLRECIDHLSQQAKNNGIAIDYEPVAGVVNANPLIENVFFNLVQNAILHSAASKIVIRGERIIINGKPHHKISIADNGRGIEEDLRETVFSPRVKRRGSPGSGLGLYLV
jgi:PAS domain S-box-containing protein